MTVAVTARVVDASVWVSVLVPQDVHHAASRGWLEQWMNAGGLVVEPAILLAEVAGAVARRTGSGPLGTRAVRHLLAFSTVRVVSLDQYLGRAAAEVAAVYRLRGADAVYVALARHLGIPLVTWDAEQMTRGQAAVAVASPS